MAHRVAGRVQTLQLHRFAHADDVPRLHAPINTRNFSTCFVMRDQLGTGGGNHLRVAAGVIMVLMGVEHLGDLPAAHLGSGQGFLMVQRVYRQGLARFRAGHQVVEIAIGVACPDALDNHQNSTI